MELIKLSKRLQTVADMVTKGSIVADIGTDHGYLPIYLVQNNISERVIAMDVNKGPLSKASHNIIQLHLENKIDTRLSDGLMNLKKEEAQTVTICGMGGKLIAKILENGRDKLTPENELILSPQSEIPQFREYLLRNDYRIIKEEMLIDDGKFYVIMKCKLQPEISQSEVSQPEPSYPDVYLKYGKYLLEHKNVILKEYLKKELKNYLKIRENVDNCNSELAEERMKQIDYELRCIEEGLNYYEM